ncbi:protein slt11 [Aspergillus nidulans FGSC A4]|uniref:Pre-mRNA-splicing factor slt11 n=1 Tax=Emericella nidulans (strain FGSC A4 / ATCC 38163 / CBS 112.46 / NRRL 194 / M139) TaxID=227321 RepID=SLT11_EMENI|nr:protein slt11 [Aspergillus nidulans FGSC A4]Q5AX35.2 RecName: Full=Pre-mRNA-splicing factor slt11 [Aspergillus nidulans FGSC A4]CBF78985.1 TPA: Pre-mRNA-splicing factor slt11 [Source:UniProtKB/Swiss-Prot;Acc:Q5AX35] [Aspergillus nidulans FGSC A4]
MPPQIKQDLNRSGWETTDFPSVCENCLPENPYVQMLKEDYGAECKICTRPFTIFRWKADRTARTKRTNICLTCARLKNCCQCCMLDLSFGLPIVVRDAALKMVAPGPQSSINREYYAQGHEKEIEEGRGAVEEYEKTDEKARELLRRLANSEPYYRKPRQLEAPEEDGETQGPSDATVVRSRYGNGPGPVRTSESRRGTPLPGRGRGGVRGGRPFPGTAQLPPSQADILPPADPNITSLFVTGVEDDLPEHALRSFFVQFGQLRSLVCSHRAHCAFINYAARESAEAAAKHCQGKAVVQGCPLRVRWGKPKALDNMDREERLKYAREGRQAVGSLGNADQGTKAITAGTEKEQIPRQVAVAPPPGSGEVQYSSMSGD